MGTMSQQISRLKRGSDTAIRFLWSQFEKPMFRVARRYLRAAPRRVADEDDVVVQAFTKLCEGASQGRFSKLNRRQDIWPLLARLTRNVALNQVRDLARLKRGASGVAGESAFARGGENGINETISSQPTPDMIATMNETCHRLVMRLDHEMQVIVQKRREGYQVAEIAESMGYSIATVERRLRVIRRVVKKELASG